MRNCIIGMLLVLFLLSISGCFTVRNTAAGTSAGVGATIAGFGKGVATDLVLTWEAIKRADKWFQENYW